MGPGLRLALPASSAQELRAVLAGSQLTSERLTPTMSVAIAGRPAPSLDRSQAPSSSPRALSNYQLGDLLGRGASGSVYRALNFLTGETVAIKSVSLLTLSPSALPDIMSEIDLLKNLNHPNIVKYKGFARDKDNLFIVLEYCENGSLQTILKKFGKFPESLVAVYISQVLEGLIYLHDQGVVHRDIKGANILTNKDGSVKLADFGVSSKTGGNDNEVVGSPYWMAPEVIEQSGASTASDIWSVGCVVMELLEGRPPYGDLAPMQALWRIVQDESMRIPDGASPVSLVVGLADARSSETSCITAFKKIPISVSPQKSCSNTPGCCLRAETSIPLPRRPNRRPESLPHRVRTRLEYLQMSASSRRSLSTQWWTRRIWGRLGRRSH